MQEIESILCPTVACDPLDKQIANRVLRHAQVHRVQHIDANKLGRKRRQREQRVDTDPLLGLARQQLRCAVSGLIPCRGGRGAGPRSATAASVAPLAHFLGRLKPSRSALGPSNAACTPKPASCDHEQPALCRCPATALRSCRADVHDLTRKHPHAPAEKVDDGIQRATHASTSAPAESIPVSVVSSRHTAFLTLSSVAVSVASVLVSVASVLLSVGTATVPTLTTRPSPPNRTSCVRRCESPALSRRSTPQSCASGVRRHLRGTQTQRQVVLDAVLGTKVALHTLKLRWNCCERAHVPRVLLHATCEHFV